MNRFQKASASIGVALAIVTLAGCTVAEAGSPETKNTPTPTSSATEARATPTPTPTPTPTVAPVTPSPTPTPEAVEPPVEFSWASLDGTWCTTGGTCATFADSAFETQGFFYTIEPMSAEQGCIRGGTVHPEYPGSAIMACPAGVATPLTLIHPAATEADGVVNDDNSRERLWFYQGLGADTYFKQ